MIDSERVDASIVILTKNEEDNIGKCLDAIYSQETRYRYEIIVIDSGSSDHTTAIVKKYSSLRLIEISPEEFGHGKTRNLGAEISNGDYIVYLNADAIPADNNWLDSLMNPLFKHRDVAAVFSRHIPKAGCYLFMVRDILASMPILTEAIVRTRAASLDFMIFSTVSCSIRRDILLKYPFEKKIITAEDQQWARLMLKHGIKIVYEPASVVFHSHNYPPRQLYDIKMKVGKATGRFKNRFSAFVLGFVLVIGGMVVKIIGDIRFILFSPFTKKIPLSKKLKEIKTAFIARAASFWGRYRGWRNKITIKL